MSVLKSFPSISIASALSPAFATLSKQVFYPLPYMPPLSYCSPFHTTRWGVLNSFNYPWPSNNAHPLLQFSKHKFLVPCRRVKTDRHYNLHTEILQDFTKGENVLEWRGRWEMCVCFPFNREFLRAFHRWKPHHTKQDASVSAYVHTNARWKVHF